MKKYKLSDKLNAFLTDNVLPQFKDGVEKNILKSFGESDILVAKRFRVEASKTMYGIEFYITLMRSDLEEIEPLKPYVWYEREKFDGNPNDYFLVECRNNGGMTGRSIFNHGLDNGVTHFMYIEKPNK